MAVLALQTVQTCSHSYLECKYSRVQGISQQTLQSLVDFIYTGRVSLCQDNVQVYVSPTNKNIGDIPQYIFNQNIRDISQDILISADMIELTDVVEKCTSFLRCHKIHNFYSF